MIKANVYILYAKGESIHNKMLDILSLCYNEKHIIKNWRIHMKALVFEGANNIALREKPKPILLNPGDAIIKIQKTTICGTDLHIMKGDVPEVIPGLILGHEGIGIVEDTGSSVTNFKPGDKVIISCITSCGKCPECKKSMYSHCTDGGWILGHLIDGTQAEYVRIPHADNSLYLIPQNVNEEAAVMLSDIFPTGFEIGVLAGKVKPGDNIVIVGSGPIGLAALLTAQFYNPARIIMLDSDDNRLKIAQKLGATDVVNILSENVLERVMMVTDNIGADVVMEAVGTPESFLTCQQIVNAGGCIANIGVHGKSVKLHLEQLWIKNITITMGLVNTTTTPLLLKMIQSGKLIPEKLITHHFRLEEITQAYEIFAKAIQSKALKVIISA